MGGDNIYGGSMEHYYFLYVHNIDWRFRNLITPLKIVPLFHRILGKFVSVNHSMILYFVVKEKAPQYILGKPLPLLSEL